MLLFLETMKQLQTIFGLLLLSLTTLSAQDFKISNVSVTKNAALQQLVFSIEVHGIAGDSVPTAIGALDGAPVLGYVFPTTLNAYDVGFDTTTGIVALALTSHPDFDDTPLWDENNDANYSNDGIVWHPHWVLLVNDTSVAGGLAVKATSLSSTLPPTNPGMPMYMDSPGFPVVQSGRTITCTVPLYRVNYQDQFNYDGVSAYMQVNTSDSTRPMLGVYEVLDIASGNLGLPYSVGTHSCDTLTMNISQQTGLGLINPSTIKVYPNPASTVVNLELDHTINLGAYSVQIFTISGMLAYQTTIQQTNTTIPVSSIGASGTYTLQIIDNATGDLKDSKLIILN